MASGQGNHDPSFRSETENAAVTRVLWRDNALGIYVLAVADASWESQSMVQIALLDRTLLVVPQQQVCQFDATKCGAPLQPSEVVAADSERLHRPTPSSPHLGKRERTDVPRIHHHSNALPKTCQPPTPDPSILPRASGGNSAAAMDLLINGCNPTSITIPTANQALRRSTLNEGVEGWAAAAENAVKEAFKTLHTAMDRDELLTLADIRRPHRMQAAAGLLPFISLTATRRTLGIPETSAIDTSSGLRLMFEYICRWSKSTISGAASAWFRLHWFCKHLKIEESERFSGPVLTAFFSDVWQLARKKKSRAASPKSSSPGSEEWDHSRDTSPKRSGFHHDQPLCRYALSTAQDASAPFLAADTRPPQ